MKARMVGVLVLLAIAAMDARTVQAATSHPTLRGASIGMKETVLGSGERVGARLDFECDRGRSTVVFVLEAATTKPARKPASITGKIILVRPGGGIRMIEGPSWSVSWKPDGRPWRWSIPDSSSWLRAEDMFDRAVFHPDPSSPVSEEILFLLPKREPIPDCSSASGAPVLPVVLGPFEWIDTEVPPRLIEAKNCPFPAGAPHLAFDPIVVIAVSLGRDGRPRQVRIARSAPGYDEAALACVREYRFVPAMSNGKPTGVLMNIPVRFEAR